MTDNFDLKAKTWDDDPEKIERAKTVAKDIINIVQPNSSMCAMEFGCGTGLLSFNLKDNFESITLVDSSRGMIEVLNEKIAKANITNFKPLRINLEDNELLRGEFDVIYSLLTMHHIQQLEPTLIALRNVLKSDGYLCIADLEKEDGSFHSSHDNFSGHKGFDRVDLIHVLNNCGFVEIHYQVSFTIERKISDEIESFPVFLLICKKK